jgi:hypothetical protein
MQSSCSVPYHCMKGPPTYCLRSVRTRIKNETTLFCSVDGCFLLYLALPHLSSDDACYEKPKHRSTTARVPVPQSNPQDGGNCGGDMNCQWINGMTSANPCCTQPVSRLRIPSPPRGIIAKLVCHRSRFKCRPIDKGLEFDLTLAFFPTHRPLFLSPLF